MLRSACPCPPIDFTHRPRNCPLYGWKRAGAVRMTRRRARPGRKALI